MTVYNIKKIGMYIKYNSIYIIPTLSYTEYKQPFEYYRVLYVNDKIIVDIATCNAREGNDFMKSKKGFIDRYDIKNPKEIVKEILDTVRNDNTGRLILTTYFLDEISSKNLIK